MAAITPANARAAGPDAHCEGRQDLRLAGCANVEGDIVIEYLDHSMAYAVPTWCSTSLLR